MFLKGILTFHIKYDDCCGIDINSISSIKVFPSIASLLGMMPIDIKIDI